MPDDQPTHLTHYHWPRASGRSACWDKRGFVFVREDTDCLMRAGVGLYRHLGWGKMALRSDFMCFMIIVQPLTTHLS